ncbi:MAG: phage Gp37/Gp68 family protein [Candidatus Aenigmarchaeota archaeon]|nr:phage Gp37/Gp68 family protein [Candidatus Aenigmarchaeota archaeon]
MANKSPIEWTNATWNPTTGCTKISAGCANCYAERLSNRLYHMGTEKYRNNFKLTLHPDALEIPLKWKEPKKIFVNSMSDLFHKDIPFSFTKKIFDVMEKASWHNFQVLTKRPEIMLEFTKQYYPNPLPNVWLGTTVESSPWKYRIDVLRKVPAVVRFLSLEPLIGPLGKLNLKGIHWVIVGGESGYRRRPIEQEWVREIRDQCIEKKVPFFFKQWGGVVAKSGGRRLDRRHWNQYPVDN